MFPSLPFASEGSSQRQNHANNRVMSTRWLVRYPCRHPCRGLPETVAAMKVRCLNLQVVPATRPVTDGLSDREW